MTRISLCFVAKQLGSFMIFKQLSDHVVVESPTCGTISEILKNGEYAPLGIATAVDIKETQGHYHETFDEIYFMLDGQITLEVYDPSTKKKTVYPIHENELFIVTKGLHHKIIKASGKNRLCVISVPPFHQDDEHPSDVL